jgi:hypothetical protein
VASLTFNPQPILGGTLAPGLPTPIQLFLVTNSEGSIELSLDGGGGPLDLYIQYLIEDPGATNGVSFSNAIKAIFQP